ncbi:hypothetical protein LEP1GSC125_0598 [Leptospira mayottensis 200901122]|uniref:Uncharacterized protein n=1 Tax=Leptospira mayottensis 200901122 TaxID=1193010 RepID=A0AA87MS36_9LEPT|nr:hypothetical protein LEP1GSC125_0598 [Leptospira mayottensis 200901122]
MKHPDKSLPFLKMGAYLFSHQKLSKLKSGPLILVKKGLNRILS